MGYKVLNNAFSTLAGSINAIAGSITVATGHGDRFPVIAGADYTYVTLEDASGNIEIVKVTARATASDVMTIERGQDGTVARSWAAGDIVELRVIALLLDAAIAHVDDTTDAHLASAIKNIPAGSISAQTVQAAINELDGDIQAVSSSVTTVSNALTAHLNDTTDAHDASAISYAGGTGMSADNVESAIDELATEKSDISAIQSQTHVAFTTSGTAPAFAIDSAPDYPTFSAKQFIVATFHAANNGVACTLSIDGTTAKSIKQLDQAGSKVNPSFPSNFVGELRSDGVDWVIQNPLPISNRVNLLPAVRQTVLTGPVDTNGLPNFGGSTGSTTVTVAGTLTATAANGDTNRTGSIVNPSFTGLSTNGTMYLFLDIAADGTCTTGSTALAPNYRWGGADVTTSNQFTFNIQEMVGKVGNGSVANQTYRVFVGEVTVAGGVVTAITWYALMGRYESSFTNTLPSSGAVTTRAHNIGTAEVEANLVIECITTDVGHAVGSRYINPTYNPATTVILTAKPMTTALSSYFVMSGAFNTWNATTGVSAALTSASWKYKVVAKRTW